jgi:chemotaxis protein MotB
MAVAIPPLKKPEKPAHLPPPRHVLRKLKRQRGTERVVLTDDGEGNWLVSYADMMTLLFGFFVMLTAFSTPDVGKIEKMREQTAKSMGVAYTKPYQDLFESLKKVLRDFHLDKEVSVEFQDTGLSLVSKGTLFFDSGSAELKPQARSLVEMISAILVDQARGFRVVVEGHTDDIPIESRYFPSNWELSSARASTVVRLLESKGFPHPSLRPMGLADTEPVVPNRTPAGVSIPANQAQNRRIVIRIEKQLPKRTTSK